MADRPQSSTEIGAAERRSVPERHDPIQQALVCLNTSGQHLRRGKAEHADEVLHLLQAALAHLQQAADPDARSSSGLQGAE